jgi:D-arabinose 5-phosphate isomerase GutQ
LNDYFRSLLKTINDSINGLDETKFDEVCCDIVNAIKDGHKPVITGLGKNVPICEKFEGTMLSLGLEARFLHTNTAAHGDLGAVRNGDVVLILSKSGETAESIYLLNQLKKRKVTIWAVTFNEKSTLSKEADKTFLIKMDNEGDKWNIVPNNSTTLYLIILQAIAITVADKLNVTLDDFRVNHPGGYIGEQLNAKR